MKNLLTLLLLLSASLFAQAPSKPAQPASPSILGFTPGGARDQAALESDFKAMISADSARDFHRIFTAEPHPAGTERNHKLAEYIAEQWKA
jgi:hypothetical protein